MDIINIVLEWIANFLWELPLSLKILVVRLGSWLIFMYFTVWFAWLKIRRILVQILTTFIVLFFSFSIQFKVLIEKTSKGVFPLLFGICLLSLLFLPGKIASLLAPEYGDELIIKRILYAATAILVVIQLFVT